MNPTREALPATRPLHFPEGAGAVETAVWPMRGVRQRLRRSCIGPHGGRSLCREAASPAPERPTPARRLAAAGQEDAWKRLRAFSSETVTAPAGMRERCGRAPLPGLTVGGGPPLPRPSPDHRCAAGAGLAPPTAHLAPYPLNGGYAVCAVRRWGPAHRACGPGPWPRSTPARTRTTRSPSSGASRRHARSLRCSDTSTAWPAPNLRCG